jgi:DNA-binding transcriptional ArsR family regulator
MRKPTFIDCQNLIFSPRLCEDRTERAQQTFGSHVVQRILCFALYLLGVNRGAIGHALGIPSETAKSNIKAMNRDGLSALEDRRRRFSTFLPQAAPEPPPVTLRDEEGHIVVDFGISGRDLKLCREDPLQLKTVLLSMLNSGLLSKQQVAEAIKFTPSHTATLARRLEEEGALCLVDRRQGQKQDYRVPPTVKAELIQQFAVDVINSGRTSGSTISAGLKKRCNIVVPARTVRHHLSRMGLGKIKGSLPQLVSAAKKTSSNYSST